MKKTINRGAPAPKASYQRPDLHLYCLCNPLNVLTTMSESVVDLEGVIVNYDEGDEFY